MARIVFIHGTFCGCRFQGFQDDCSTDGGYVALRPLLLNKQAKLYYWAQIETQLNFIQCFNPFAFAEIFRAERNYINTREAVYALHTFLEKEQPEIIVSHSLGCHYLLNCINEYSLPQSCKSIVTLLPEFHHGKHISDIQTIEKLKHNELDWHNYYCPWDPTLLSSIYVSGLTAGGTFRWSQPFIHNHFYIQYPWGNLHTQILRNRRFIHRFIENIDTLEVRAGKMV
jgi:hypothetical protein